MKWLTILDGIISDRFQIRTIFKEQPKGIDMRKLTLDADKAPTNMIRYFGLYGMFNVNVIPNLKTNKPEKFEVYGQMVEKGMPHFHDIVKNLLNTQ